MHNPIANPINDLREIRSLMERSRYFIGLSGLSGIGAGLFALLGVMLTVWYQEAGGGSVVFILRSLGSISHHPWGIPPLIFLLFNGIFVFTGAVFCGYYFTRRRAFQYGQRFNDKKTFQLFFHLAVPLVVGGIFCVALVFHEQGALIAPATLIFYGLALLNGSGYAKEELSYLGYLEIGLGLVACFFPGYGLHFWAIGFGVLHIMYGSWMYYKYDLA
ncbi:MAG: hypothetical protein AAF828_03085 [Bacteroidota bacterium]